MYGPSGIRTAPSLSGYGSKHFMFHYILDHIIIDEPLLLLERIHKRFFAHPVDHSRNPGRSFMDLVHCFGSKELMSQDELAVMDGGKCILQLRGVRPFLSEKFDITKHPNYKYLSDYDKKNAFDIERFLSARLKLRPDEQFAAYSIDLSGDEAAEETGG